MPPVLDDAICVRHWDWSETSQTVSVFCRALGLIRGLAKGSRRPASPYSGGIEILTRGGIGIIVRPSSDLALITEWDLQETFPALRRSLRAHYAAMYMADLIHHAVHDRDPHTALFDALLAALRSLGGGGGGGGSEDDAARAIDAPLLRFQWATLLETGYRPLLEIDPASGGGFVRFSPSLGGVLSAADTDRDDRAWRVRRETIRAIKRIADLGEDSQPQATDVQEPQGQELPDASADDLHRANRLLAAYLRHVLGREPRTLALLFGKRLPS